MDLRLNGKVALVTGTGSQIGYGKAIALTLAKEGCDIISADIDFEGAKKTASVFKTFRYGMSQLSDKLVEKIGPDTFVCGKEVIKTGYDPEEKKYQLLFKDVIKRNEVEDMVKGALNQFNKIDILVNNAGASSELKPFLEMTKADWDFDIQVNLYGQMNVAQAVLPHMLSRRYGRIINVSGGQGIPTISVYGAAKAGIEAFTQALAREVGASGVIVNAVGPGLAMTGLVQKAPASFVEAYRQSSVLKRLCTPEDVAPVVAFLASDVCSYMVGQCLRLNAS